MSTSMSRRRFVDALAEVALDEVVASEVEVMRSPPGRRPPADLLARAEWFATLEPDAQALVVGAMRATAYASLHRVLVVLDGGTALDEAGSAGRLQLLWHGDDDVTDLTESSGSPDLHDMLAEHQR